MKTRRHHNNSDVSDFDPSTAFANPLQPQFLQQLDLNRQLREELERERDLVRKYQYEAQSAEDGIWSEKSHTKMLENEVNDLRLQMKEQ